MATFFLSLARQPAQVSIMHKTSSTRRKSQMRSRTTGGSAFQSTAGEKDQSRVSSTSFGPLVASAKSRIARSLCGLSARAAYTIGSVRLPSASVMVRLALIAAVYCDDSANRWRKESQQSRPMTLPQTMCGFTPSFPETRACFALAPLARRPRTLAAGAPSTRTARRPLHQKRPCRRFGRRRDRRPCGRP